jgi:hypothetical protein
VHLLGAVEALQVGEDGPDGGALSGGASHAAMVPGRPARTPVAVAVAPFLPVSAERGRRCSR